MERPPYLRSDVYDEILRSLRVQSREAAASIARACGYKVPDAASLDAVLASVLERPAPYLYRQLGVLSRADVLAGMFIEFNDGELDEGLTYLIDQESADEIAAGEPTILLRIGAEGVLVSRKRVEHAFATDCAIDYREAARQSPP